MPGIMQRESMWLCALTLFFACGQAKRSEPGQTAHGKWPEERSTAPEPVEVPRDVGGDASPLGAADAAASGCDGGEPLGPLEAAAFTGDAERARLLIVAAEQDAAARPACGLSALALAITPYTEEPDTPPADRRIRHQGKLDAAGLFLTRCFEVLRPDEHGTTALHVAVTAPYPDRVVTRLIRRMLQCDPRPDPKTSEGVTPLMLAIQAKRKQVVKLLLEVGADVNARSLTLETPLELAQSGGDRELLSLVRKAVPRDAGM